MKSETVEVGLCSLELNFRGTGLDSFFCEIRAEKPGTYTLQADENGEAHGSVCLKMKRVLSMDSSHNNSSVDDVPSQ